MSRMRILIALILTLGLLLMVSCSEEEPKVNDTKSDYIDFILNTHGIWWDTPEEEAIQLCEPYEKNVKTSANDKNYPYKTYRYNPKDYEHPGKKYPVQKVFNYYMGKCHSIGINGPFFSKYNIHDMYNLNVNIQRSCNIFSVNLVRI